MFDQREEGAFTVVERDEVDIIKHSRISYSAELGIYIASPEGYRYSGIALFDRSCDAERAIQITWKRHGQTDQRWLDPFKVRPERFQ
jgi:hypothetical protein